MLGLHASDLQAFMVQPKEEIIRIWSYLSTTPPL
jgi:hypothetical protein